MNALYKINTSLKSTKEFFRMKTIKKIINQSFPLQF